MDATSMPSMNSLLSQLQLDYPQWDFKPGEQFAWSSSQNTIYYTSTDDPAYILHELAHALLSHSSYTRDIELLKMERDAWSLATEKLAPSYGIVVNDDLVQNNLDTYRDWLHARSLCPECSSVGYQSKHQLYICPVCESQWRVNEARTCELRRYKI